MTRPLALFLSPHLDDAVFSCGGLAARLAEAGWRVEIVTAFTASRLNPTGFALECQTDKGLAPDIDYMALRRTEDARACETLGATARWLDLPEAPHRGYASAGELFAGVRADDNAAAALAPLLADLATMAPDLVLTAEGIGGHVDHVVLRRAVEAQPGLAAQLAYWRDEPYATRRDAPRAREAAACRYLLDARAQDRGGALLHDPARLPVRRRGGRRPGTERGRGRSGRRCSRMGVRRDVVDF